MIPASHFGELTAEQMLKMEIVENLIRNELTWQEKTRMLSLIHKEANAGEARPNVSATARALISAGEKRDPDTVRKEVQKAAVVAEHLHDPRVAKAKTVSEAYSIISKNAKGLAASLASKFLTPEESIHTLIEGDFRVHHETLREEQFNLVLCDPPYGAEADKWKTKFRDTPHEYDDSLDHALEIYSAISRMGMEWTAARANLFMFCAPQYWHLLHKLVQRDGWAPWPRPIIWKKSNEGIRPHGQLGFAYTYETILYATKGGMGLLRSISDVIEVYKVSTAVRLHGAQKPAELYKQLIDITCRAGDKICDPTAGSGTIFEAASLTGTIATGAEINPEYIQLCRNRIAQLSQQPTPEEEQMDIKDL
jgi:DNA modification methylase